MRHASLIAGGAHLCALTRVIGGTQQVVCTGVDTVTEGPDERRVPRVWESPPLVQLVAQDAFAQEPAAIGLLADGHAVEFTTREARPRALYLPDTGAHGPVVALHRVMNHVPAGCGVIGVRHGYTVVRTRDGALLGTADLMFPTDGYRGWTQLLAAGEGATGAFAWVGTLPCAATARDVRCGREPFVVGERGTPELAERVMDVRDVAELASGAGWLCARDLAGMLRCARYDFVSERWSSAAVEGAPRRADAMAMGDADLCVRGGSRWWCASGPSADSPVYLPASPLPLHAEPLLDGAAEVALAARGGCARWPDGAVRCWDRDLRGGGFTRRGPTEIRGLPEAIMLAAGQAHSCAVARGEVWCWGRLAPRPSRVPLPAGVRAIASNGRGFAAVGATVWSWCYDFAPTPVLLDNPPGDDAAIDALAAVSEAVCARRVDGRVTCWREEWREADPEGGSDTHKRRDEAVRVRALEGYERFEARGGEVCAWTPSRGGHCWGHESGESERWISRSVRPRDVEPPVRVEGPCVVFSDGDRRCDDGEPPPVPPPATPPWALDPRGETARLLDGSPQACAVLAGGGVACKRSSPETYVHHQGRDYLFPLWEVLPGLTDVRALAMGIPGGRDIWPGHGCALRGDGRVFCWGANLGGSLTADDADRAPRLVPLRR